MTRILIADDHALVRYALKRFIESQDGLQVVGEAVTGQEACEMAAHCDVMILDLALPGLHGMDVLMHVKMNYPKLPVLVLSGQPEDQYAMRCFRAGARGYLAKGAPIQELVDAIGRVVKGGRYVSRALAEKVLFDFDGDDEKDLHDELSDREFQVLRLLASGSSVGEIAHELCLSSKTISTYRRRILDKLNLETNAQLMRYAMSNGLVDWTDETIEPSLD